MLETSVSVIATFSYCPYEGPDGWTVCRYREKDTSKEFVATGHRLPKSKGVGYKLTGHWGKSRKTGATQLDVEYFEVAELKTLKELTAFLGAMKCGFGPAKAQKIYKAFGSNSWEIIDKTPERLLEIHGISAKALGDLKTAMATKNVIRDMTVFLAEASVSIGPKTMDRLITALGPGCVDQLRNDPYCAFEQDILSFEKSEAIAVTIGFPKDAPSRLRAIVLQTLKDAEQNGSVCLPTDIVLQTTCKRSGSTEEQCKAAIKSLFLERRLRTANNHLYLAFTFDEEAAVADGIKKLLLSGSSTVTSLDAFLRDYERAQGVVLADAQKDAVKAALDAPVSIITGGPGVGKTTVTKAILAVHKAMYGEESQPVLLAPTGKAARRLSETTGLSASTIHSAIGWRGEDTPTPLTGDYLPGNLIIVDEASMCDQTITAILLARIEPGSHVVFIGDVDQLPSVGRGNVLDDMIRSSLIPTTRLTVIYRQSETSPIIENAARINAGRTDMEEARGFKFLETRGADDTFMAACKMYLKCVRAYGVENVLLLNPQRRNTALSVDAFNRVLQDQLNPAKPDQIEMKVGGVTYRVGDRVMETVNGETARNGDVGTIIAIDRQPSQDDPMEWSYQAVVEFEPDNRTVEYSVDEVRRLDHAWCVTIHKAQGTEVQTVVEVVSLAHPSMLRRNLVYTGITRARENVAIIGEREAFEQAVLNAKKDHRYTLLAQRLFSLRGKTK